ncbi:MAG: NADH-quinone oxidoreductase subunit NuoG, partial [Gammaproteobacteria bacterium]|nr:NADH-quinone oxidoreductase subunit NuoG [Gammaproteobacteria bacterium]NNJ73300.1 NADH-quinone oxidoreductase subunit G [Enterobacterales bacterium]
MASIEIDGVKVEAELGSMIIEAADSAGIKIPRFCYHKRLSVAANCRMCLVDVGNLPKPVPACATPVSDGMTVNTHSKRALDAQKSVMEFLLINHPLDCPICDQGGECELQDVAMGYGNDVSRFNEGKRIVEDKDIGPLITTDMTRCIHCTRCVRFGTEIAGIREMGETGRGEHMRIGTYIEKSIDSEVSGNIIDLCPVGALTAKPSRYKARSWEMEQRSSIAPHDCLGSNIFVHSRRSEVIRVVPRENDDINESWISDRDRFSYAALNSDNRMLRPMVRENGKLVESDWPTALNVVLDGINKVTAANGEKSLGAIASPSATTEELFLLQKLIRGLGSDNIDTRLRRLDFSQDAQDALYPSIGCQVTDLEHMQATLLVGSNLRKEQPIAAVHLRKSTFEGKVMAINSIDCDYNFRTSPKIVTDTILDDVMAVAKAMAGQSDSGSSEAQQFTVEVSAEHEQIAKNLVAAENGIILLGQYAYNHPDYSQIAAVCQLMASMSKVKFGCFSDGANSAGAHLVGAIPYRDAKQELRNGQSIGEMLDGGVKAMFVQGLEPGEDISAEAKTAMANMDIVIALTPFADSELCEYAHVVLPIAGFTETSGTLINTSGEWQTFNAAVSAKGEARPAWKVYRVLGNIFDVEGFNYNSSNEVLEELKNS